MLYTGKGQWWVTGNCDFQWRARGSGEAFSWGKGWWDDWCGVMITKEPVT
jgi:hypothetical protein